ncbi:DUF554 domain-containing protein [Candidatus Bathyarchaeota archaeon]|nr:DUF554 domain-containing protein [Candidatus Bathyarchaeota archaeon]
MALGSFLGLALRRELPERIRKIAFQGVGLATLFIGIKLALQTTNIVTLFLSILFGAIIGGIIDVQSRLERLCDILKAKIRSKDEKFTEGMLTAFLIFCVGPMTILGSVQDGLSGDPSVLVAKSILDGFVSVSLASTLGIGVLFSTIPLFIFQGTITLLASYSYAFFTDTIVVELGAVGGILLLGLGIKLLEIKNIDVTNLLPSLLIVPLAISILR